MNQSSPFFSIIVPVFNRPQELKELLLSLKEQIYRNFEVIIVEDGSVLDSAQIVSDFSEDLRIGYFKQSNQGPGPARNFGFNQASGDFMISFDSDCIIPPGYLVAVVRFMRNHEVDAWGGPDSGHPDFTPLQQAMAYTMSGLFTTGGIRGGLKSIDRFQPRSFNMGISRKVFEYTLGFRFDRYAEDIELSIRIRSAGFRTWLISDAYVFHKRRTSFKSFFKQVRNFGRGRIDVSRVHKGAIRPAHWLPFIFTSGLFLGLFSGIFWTLILHVTLLVYGLYFILIFADAWRKTRSITSAILAVPSALVQLSGYAYGFIFSLIRKS
ncbi:MAG: glycosyltransferase [Cyclobacteriaceae bacterium]